MELSKALKGFVTIAIIAMVLAVVWYLSSVVVYILLAAILAIVGRPLVNRLSKIHIGGWCISRSVAASITLMIMWIIIGGLGIIFIPLVVGKVDELLDIVKLLERIFTEVFNKDVLATFSNVASSLASVAVGMFSVTFISFFFLRDEGLFRKIVAMFFSEDIRDNIYKALDSITSLLRRYFGGLMVESTMLMIVISVAMMLFGMKFGNALITGLIMGVMNLIPYAGPVMGCAVAMIMGVITPIDGNIGYTLIVIGGTIMVVKIIDDFIIQPTLYSERVNAHPLEIFIVILISGHIGGVLGMLLAIPLYTIVRVIAREFFSEYGVVRRLTREIK